MNSYIANIAKYFKETIYSQNNKELDALIYDAYIKELVYKLISYRVSSLSVISVSDYDYLLDLLQGRTTATEEKLKERNEILPDLYTIMRVVHAVNKTDFDVIVHCLDPKIN